MADLALFKQKFPLLCLSFHFILHPLFYVTQDDSQRQFMAQFSMATLLQDCLEWLQHCSCAKNSRCKSQRVTFNHGFFNHGLFGTPDTQFNSTFSGLSLRTRSQGFSPATVKQNTNKPKGHSSCPITHLLISYTVYPAPELKS